MATELLRSSTKKANRVALHVKNKHFFQISNVENLSFYISNIHQLLSEQKQVWSGE